MPVDRRSMGGAGLLDWLRKGRAGRLAAADAAFERGRVALDAGQFDEARAGFEAAIRLGKDNAPTWFNLGLACKFQRDWRWAIRANRKATEHDPDNREAHWNLGVAATARREWRTAHRAWRALEIPVGDGPVPDADFGPTPIRLDPDGRAEVVWGRRIDPCRARIESVPLPESGHRWRDIVLHDVVPAGSRMLGDRSFSVFDELLRMEPGPFETRVIRVTAPGVADRDALLAAIVAAGGAAEDWTSSVRMLCAACSRGEPHEHAGADVDTWEADRRVGIAAGATATEAMLAAWRSSGDGRSVTPAG